MNERREWPKITSEIPAAGGLVKAGPEDFEVEEIPAYEPSGEGDHLYLWVEKRGRETSEVARMLARAGGVSEREVGYAGLKDRQAVTRQWFSLPASAEAGLAGFAEENVRVLATSRHRNKLRTGHLRGNRFRIRVRDVKDEGAAREAFRILGEKGIPNYFGEQRFGREDDNAAQGKKLILGERLARAPSPFQRKMYLSAWQSLLFNRALAQRIEEGTFERALEGDVLKKSDTGGLFVCEEPSVDQERVDRFEVSPAGPLFGPKMPQASGEVAQREAALLQEEGVTLEDLKRGRGETEGGRRAYRISMEEGRMEREGADLLIQWVLPKGSYATVVLGEILKTA